MALLFRTLMVGLIFLSAPAGAAEKLRVNKAVAFAWTFTPLDVGMQTGIFAKNGLEIEASASASSRRVYARALASNPS